MGELEPRPRAVAIGTFDGVHLGHRRVLEAALARRAHADGDHVSPASASGALGNQIELVSSIERRLELLEEAGVEDVLVLEFTPELAALEAEEFAASTCSRSAPRWSSAARASGSGAARTGISRCSSDSGSTPARCLWQTASPRPQIRQLLRAGEVATAARLLGRPAEVEGTVVAGDARGGTLGFPTANLAVPPQPARPGVRHLRRGGGEHRAAVSIGVNPHYGGRERRSRRSCSTSRAISTAGVSSSSSGGACVRSAPSTTRTSSSPRSHATWRTLAPRFAPEFVGSVREQ